MSTVNRNQVIEVDPPALGHARPPVSLLRWPAEDDLRRKLFAEGHPRLLLVDAAAEPPEVLDALEDWVRAPFDPADVEARAKALLVRMPAQPTAVPVPVLDDDGLLRVGRAWVVIPLSQIAVVHLLVDNLDRVVRIQAIADAYTSAGASGHPASVRTLLSRVGVRVRGVGLELVTVRQRGVLLRSAVP